MILHVCTYASPLGPLLLVSDGSSLVGAYFEGQRHFPEDSATWVPDPEVPPLPEARRQLAEYFARARRGFQIPLVLRGTDFQRRVWRLLEGIPWGSTLSYGDLAARLGAPAAVRAVGAAVGRNPVSILVPCHRALGRGGALTGYAGGLERKRALLELESPPRLLPEA